MAEAYDQIHPLFANASDTNAAVAMSEYFLQSERFVRSTRNLYGLFPPEPAHVVATSIAYLETTGKETVVRRQLGVLDFPLAHKVDVVPEVMARYTSAVRPVQESLIGVVPKGVVENKLLDPIIELTKAEGLQTIGAFVVAVSKNGKRFYHGLVVPRVVHEKSPLIYRNFIMGIISDSDRRHPRVKKEFSESDTALLSQIRQNGPVMQEAAFQAVGILMPEPAVIAEYFRTTEAYNFTAPLANSP
jgi:hypothetical protein